MCRDHAMIKYACFVALAVVATTLIDTARAQITPSISFISKKQQQNIGGMVNLRCAVQHREDNPVYWVKVNGDGENLISTQTTRRIPDTRFSVRYKDASSSYILKIKDIQETDAGLYKCQVASPDNIISAQVELRVLIPPFFINNSTDSVVSLEGSKVRLECYAKGFPRPKISWHRANSAILPTGGSTYRRKVLKIAHVSKEDRGTYYCLADNGVGPGVKRNVYLEVRFAPVITVPRPRFGQALQRDVAIGCHIEAHPLPDITWHKNDVQLFNNQHHSISIFAGDDESTDTTIHISTVEKRHYGKYVCKATNNFGSATAAVELFETITPVCAPACG